MIIIKLDIYISIYSVNICIVVIICIFNFIVICKGEIIFKFGRFICVVVVVI